MDQHDTFFTPERVDEQIDQARGAKRAIADDQFLAEMQQAARQVRAEQERSLRRVEDRLIQHALAHPEKRAVASSEGPRRLSSPRIVQQGSIYSMEKQKEQKKSRMSGLGRRISLLVAVLVMAVLVGSLVFVMNAAHPKTVQHANNTYVGAAHTPIATPTSTSAFGKTVYTTPTTVDNFAELSWSPDSTRVASMLMDIVQIWDATTGLHRVTITMPNGVFHFDSLAWSPNSQLVAIGTDTGILVVNGQTGAIVHNYAVIGSLADTLSTGNSSTLLSARMPADGGMGVRGLAWSPDGKFLAVAVSEGQIGKLLVLNPQTGTVDYTLPITGSYIPTNLSWSADSKYLAANVQNTDGNAQANQIVMAWVWNLATKQVVFQHTSMNGSDSLAWSPNSDILAFDGQETAIQITLWNAATNQVTPYSFNAAGPLAWSPNGKYIVFAESAPGQTSVEDVIDVGTGKLVYHKKLDAQVGTLAWSPNGHYIASGEADVARVWTAE